MAGNKTERKPRGYKPLKPDDKRRVGYTEKRRRLAAKIDEELEKQTQDEKQTQAQNKTKSADKKQKRPDKTQNGHEDKTETEKKIETEAIIVEPLTQIIADKHSTNGFIDWVQGREELPPVEIQRSITAKNERMRLALNHLSNKGVCSMSKTQDFIHTCSSYLFRPERLNGMTDGEITETMMTAMAMFSKESEFVLKVVEANKDLTTSPTKRTRLMDMIENLPKDVLEALLAQVKGQLK